MSRFLDTHHLAALVKTKRGSRSLRDVAQDLEDVSPSTLSRIENEKMVDVQTFLRICDWLQVAPQEFLKDTDEVREQEMTTAERIEVALRTDRTLSPEYLMLCGAPPSMKMDYTGASPAKPARSKSRLA